jgi:xylulose-5-phosphate/fructose-6-phosphate phosphoketolase
MNDFLVFGPDEVASNRLQDMLDVGGRKWFAEVG